MITLILFTKSKL